MDPAKPSGRPASRDRSRIDARDAKRLLDAARKRGMFAGLEDIVPYAAQPGAALGLGLLHLTQQ
jgi:hypothetical protein